MPELVAPDFVKEGPNGSVIVDPAKVPPEGPPSEKPAETAERPEWLPEKFKSAEDLAKAYGELERKLGAPLETPAPSADEAKAKGVDLSKLEAEYRQNGKLSAESLADLATKGFTEAHVKAYVEGVQAKATQVRNEFAEVAGGEEQLTSVLKWAEANLPAEEQKAYNDLLDAGNTTVAKIMLQNIVSRYAAENGESPELVEAAPVPNTAGIKRFESMAEVVRAMQDPKYHTDSAYRRKVEMRLSISDV